MRDKAEVMSELRGMLVDVFLARENGEHGARIARVTATSMGTCARSSSSAMRRGKS